MCSTQDACTQQACSATDGANRLPHASHCNRYSGTTSSQPLRQPLHPGGYRWIEAYAIPNKEPMTVANKLTEEMFLRFCSPEQLHSDQRRQFECSPMSEICHLLGIQKSCTTPYHPQGDGLVELFNRILLNMLASFTQEHPSTWEDHLRVCMAYELQSAPVHRIHTFLSLPCQNR